MIILILLIIQYCKPKIVQTFFNGINNDNFSDCSEDYGEKRSRLQKYTKRYFKSSAQQLGYLAVCVVAKNEHQNIREWIQYHVYMGVSKIYLYDNGSRPPLIATVQDYADAGILDYTYYTRSYKADDFELIRKTKQSKVKSFWKSKIWHYWAYDSCIHHYGHRHKFIAFIDIDEFLILTDKKYINLPQFLKKFENFGGIVVYRRFFGSSGHKKRPNGTVLENNTKCTKKLIVALPQHLPKMIVNMNFYDGYCSVHFCKTKIPTVNSQMQIDDSKNFWKKDFQFRQNITWQGLRINHYFIKSYEDVWLKYKRLHGNNTERIQQKVNVFFNKTDRLTVADCLEGIELSKKCCQNNI